VSGVEEFIVYFDVILNLPILVINTDVTATQ
jgi:hypothetical protein